MKFFLHVFIVMMLAVSPVHAQSQNQSQGTGENLNNIPQERIDELIKTLESQTAREDFINNLKTLNEAKNQEEQKESKLNLNIDENAEGLIKLYEDFIAGTGLNEDTAGRVVMTLGTLVVAFILGFIVRKLSRLLKSKLNKIRNHYGLIHGRFRIYARGIRYVGYLLIAALAMYTIGVIWGLAETNIIFGDAARTILVMVSTVLLVILIAIIIWEVINTAIENYLRSLEGTNAARIRTILPLARNVLFVVFLVLFTLVILSELGINVVPLLAGAGVLGIAIGFGAQTMVKDFLTGFTIILEDLIQVGDVAKLSDRIGVVERITIRKVQLRDLAGIVYTVPFSEIHIVENWTKDFSFYVFDVGIAYREDPDEVIGYLKEIGDEMAEDEEFKDLILEPLEIMGVDKFADSAVVIKARIKTQPIKQWAVGREFNRRMKHKFDKHNVEIPFPHQTLYFGVDKKGHAPAAPIEVLEHAGKTDKQVDKKTKDKTTKKLKKSPQTTDPKEGKGDNSDK